MHLNSSETRMPTRNWSPIALCLTWIGLLVAFWPSGCASHGVPATDAASEAKSGVAEHGSALSLRDLLPQPALALAGESVAPSVTIADVAELVTPSVVSVASRRTTRSDLPTHPFFRRFFGPGAGPQRERQQKGLGSGVVVSNDGLILTNNHVVEGADEITVSTADGKDYDAQLVGADDKSDVAVLRVSGDLSALAPLRYGDSSKLRIGDVVLAIGNPFGVGQTVTMGIVSAKGRSETGIVAYADFIQTDAAINPGNSGGALVNMRGELVGINTAILSRSGGYQGIGFAIPSNMAATISKSLVEHGRVVRGWLGIGIQDVDSDLAEALGLPSASGVLVNHVQSQSPAERGGVLRGDVILSVAGKAMKTSNQLRNAIAAAGANQTVQLRLLRAGKSKTLSVRLGERESQARAPNKAPKKPSDELQGLSLETLSSKHRRELELPRSVTAGVVVRSVAPGSVAARSGMRPGDVIVELNRTPVKDLSSFQRSVRSSKAKAALLLVYRGGQNGGTRYVVLKGD